MLKYYVAIKVNAYEEFLITWKNPYSITLSEKKKVRCKLHVWYERNYVKICIEKSLQYF